MPSVNLATHLDGISQGVVGHKLQVPQTHACDWACPVALSQPFCYALTIVGVASGYHHGVAHKLHGDRAIKACWPLWRSWALLRSTTATYNSKFELLCNQDGVLAAVCMLLTQPSHPW
jgi:hypothetical protein